MCPFQAEMKVVNGNACVRRGWKWMLPKRKESGSEVEFARGSVRSNFIQIQLAEHAESRLHCQGQLFFPF